MFFQWLKRYMPRGLYGRAALILVLPVVTLQLVVSVIFIQRHFADVTEQLTEEVALSLNLVMSDQADTSQELARGLAFVLEEVPPGVSLPEDVRRWYDFSGIVVKRVLNSEVPGLQRVLLPDDEDVFVYVQAGNAMWRARFDRRRASASNPHQLLVNMVFFGILMTFIAFFYLRNQLRPITRLARAAEAFGRGRTVAYSPSGALEVRSAGSAFLDMRARIDRQIEQRTMMLSGVSHDLRTPLTRLRLGLSMLDDDDRDALLRDVDEMQQLVDAFLDFARLDAEPVEVMRADPIELVRGVVEAGQRGGKKVELGLVEGAGEIELRPLSMRRAVENLIGNAVRYGCHCQVSVVLTERALRIRVEDDGPGIPRDQREDAVKAFVRLDPSRNQDRGSGVGLGLAIAADVARSHGGVLRLGESETLGGLCADIVIAR